ncbi:hypothetical protein E2C01_022590 [Portunus trituberculatus]|uniref:Uncharacterized protein n=1 Tax=Portunus trituberculatus TaxID=210409 RepID=A0A5B7E5S8_PORTR|nr:hypothetical protein [Portunus trituberculatus]
MLSLVMFSAASWSKYYHLALKHVVWRERMGPRAACERQQHASSHVTLRDARSAEPRRRLTHACLSHLHLSCRPSLPAASRTTRPINFCFFDEFLTIMDFAFVLCKY